MTGARAKIYVDNVLVGIFDSCDFSVTVSAEPIFLLGRFSAAEITPTAYEAISLNCSGFRIIGNGGHVLPKVPKLQDLINLEAVTIAVTDRHDESKAILTAHNCIPVHYSGSYNAKANSKIRISYSGLILQDESGSQDESAGAVELP